ncbi:hypothetical protein [Ulvibacter litoralis]|uniref:Peptidase family M48 n=1 Tax=Ulvibacter litoralis TaxID=227084 RepID=A0A1G7HZT3_9FLAO|nr:hypothetical protein [Ulvibacter litoralis]GHC62936.1 hypothetical protein GCM10008083_30250 [Ulvibacter litoralis]SDF06001.1 hypothetical protein SAMN05421855_10525 [Ulvibacter litoralis]
MTLTARLLAFLYFPFYMIAQEDINIDNKIIPESIKTEAINALSYYPELNDTEITFKFKDEIKKSTMQAQPKWTSFFKGKKKRSYIILISRKIQIDTESFSIDDIPSNILVGWIGHELGHIMDYRDRTNMGMLIFGIKYLYSKNHIQEVEHAADVYAIAHGMGDYILQTKNFILEHANISEKYKNRLRKLYMSPEEVMHLIEEGKLESKLE